MQLLLCPHFKGEVAWTVEREAHFAERHPDLLPEHRGRVVETIADPDQVRFSARFGRARLFSRWYPDLRDGKHVVVVVITDEAPVRRHWIVTAYIARKLAEGDIEWRRS